MKNEKFCFNKSVGVIVLMVIALGIFAAAASQFTNQPTSTNTKAAGVNPTTTGIPQSQKIPDWTQLIAGIPYALRLSKIDIRNNSHQFAAINPATKDYFYNNLNQYYFSTIRNSNGTEEDGELNRKMGFFIFDVKAYEKKSAPCYTSSSDLIEAKGFFSKQSSCQGKQIKIYQNILPAGIWITFTQGPYDATLYLLDNPEYDGKKIDRTKVFPLWIPYAKEVTLTIDKFADYKVFSNKDITILPTTAPSRKNVR